MTDSFGSSNCAGMARSGKGKGNCSCVGRCEKPGIGYSNSRNGNYRKYTSMNMKIVVGDIGAGQRLEKELH
jgi:hypothetical protein